MSQYMELNVENIVRYMHIGYKGLLPEEIDVGMCSVI